MSQQKEIKGEEARAQVQAEEVTHDSAIPQDTITVTIEDMDMKTEMARKESAEGEQEALVEEHEEPVNDETPTDVPRIEMIIQVPLKFTKSK